jgi:ribosomal protein S13
MMKMVNMLVLDSNPLIWLRVQLPLAVYYFYFLCLLYIYIYIIKMVDSILPFRIDKTKKISDLGNLNIFQFFKQRYGIGKNISTIISSYSGYHKKTKFGVLEKKNSYILFRYKDFFIEKKKFLDNYLLDEMKNNIKNYILTNSIKGKKLKAGMPIRGQRIKTNAVTAKKLKSKLNF